ncbi:hypothetical protein HMPREF1092_02521 [Clostridium thermobutyricum]|uniref:PDZ domain-containing protein n=1 Tax=Clostridium thermobutyricum TaxID=29372 RepID=N9WBV7_9CLOT|nr:trypsin-like peptidase domain-containing protein [Clostridium thermobutyricum]ENZ00355.1 hypothetical protein HMPREF1092_02521 [Clostridium thermobutyricum]
MSINTKKTEKRQGKINIKNKTPLFTRNNLYIFIIIIVTAIITGVVTTEYVNNKVSNLINNAVNSSESNNITANIIKQVSPSLVTIGSSEKDLSTIEVNPNNTTGVVISKEGLIITSYDFIKDMKDIYVKLPAKGVKAEKAVLLGYDKDTGIAVLKINGKNLTPISYSNQLSYKTGDVVESMGNATGDNYIGMITPGVITSTNYSIKIDGERYSIIQTNAIMDSQNYGGVLCNSKGQMIGFNSEYLTKKYNLDGLYFAIGNDAVVKSVQDILNQSNVLGVEGAELDNKTGFYISNIGEGSPAQKAGLKATDIIKSVDGKDMDSLEDFYTSVKGLKKGENIKLDILRDGKSKEVNITI